MCMIIIDQCSLIEFFANIPNSCSDKWKLMSGLFERYFISSAAYQSKKNEKKKKKEIDKQNELKVNNPYIQYTSI